MLSKLFSSVTCDFSVELFLCDTLRNCEQNKQKHGFLLFLLWYYWGSWHLSITGTGNTSCSPGRYCSRQVLSNITPLKALETFSASCCEQFLPTWTQSHLLEIGLDYWAYIHSLQMWSCFLLLPDDSTKSNQSTSTQSWWLAEFLNCNVWSLFSTWSLNIDCSLFSREYLKLKRKFWNQWFTTVLASDTLKRNNVSLLSLFICRTDQP